MYMKYLTKEELDHIATSLIENPSYETIKKLDIEFESKYNIGGPVVSASTSSNVKPSFIIVAIVFLLSLFTLSNFLLYILNFVRIKNS